MLHHVLFVAVTAYVLAHSIMKFPFTWLSACELSTPLVNARCVGSPQSPLAAAADANPTELAPLPFRCRGFHRHLSCLLARLLACLLACLLEDAVRV